MALSKEFEKNLQNFSQKYSDNVRLVFNIPFKKKAGSSKNTAHRNVLVISSNGLSKELKDSLLSDYRNLVGKEFLSFSVWERTTHLLMQCEGAFFDFGFWVIPYWFNKELKTKLYRFRKRRIKFPNSRRLEPLISVSQAEINNTKTYFDNLRRGYKRVLGNYYDPGCQITNAKLDDNKAQLGHNCTSWITTAPIGENSECLIELLGTDRSHQVGTNPGWWIHWILYAAAQERVPLVLYWSPDPLSEILNAQVRGDEPIHWDFNRM